MLWSLATLEARGDELFLEAADALCDSSSKLSVCDPVSVSKAAWALVGVPSRDRRLQLFSRLSAPVVLRADAFPLGALTMTGYAFAKADHRGADVYEALSAAVVRFPDEDLRPIDVCNIIWAFCTVGFRDDELFTRLCTGHLLREDSVARFNAQDITNIMWGFCKVVFMHGDAMAELARGSLKIHDQFKPIHHANLLYSFATLTLRGPAGFLGAMADSALARVDGFDCGNLAIAAWSLARLQVHHPLMDSIHRVALRPDVCGSFTSRSLSMLFLAFFCADRARHVDAVLDAALGSGAPVGASGWSAALMTAEQGQDPDREWRFLRAFAEEVQDERMQAAICNSHAIRLLKRSGPEDALRHLSAVRPSGVRCWSAVSECMRARLWRASPGHGDEVPNPAHLLEAWEGPVKSGIHPLAATRQNEGPHAYAREFMTLHAVLGSAPARDVDACMRAVEDFAEARSLWLKITAWEKAIVVHEAARQARPRLVLEIGAYVGYSAMNLGRAVRPHGGRVVSLEVDPIHVTVVRNMVEYAGLTDTVDVWTGYCSDVFPHLVGRYGPRSIGMVFMDQKGTRFHHDLRLLEELGLLEDGAVILADNVLKPGAPEYIWHLCRGPYVHPTAVSVREFLLQSEDWMVMAFHDASGTPVPQPPPLLHRLAFESDAFRRRSMFDGVAPSKADWWAFSQRFVDGLASCGVKPRVVGLHGRDNPVITPADIARIFQDAGRSRAERVD